MNNLPATANQDLTYTGYEGLEETDYSTARIIINQPQSTAIPPEVEDGKIYNKLTGEAHDTFPVIIVGVKKTRIYWGDSEDKPLCSSNDGRVPRDDAENPGAALCTNCPRKEWGENHKPPECSERFSFLAIERSTGTGVMFDMERTSYPIGRNMVSAIRGRQWTDENGERHPARICDVPVVLSTQLRQSGSRTYYVWHFRLDQWENEEEHQMFVDVVLALASNDINTIMDNEEIEEASQEANVLKDVGKDEELPWQ